MTTARLGWKLDTASPEGAAVCALTWRNKTERTKRITPS